MSIRHCVIEPSVDDRAAPHRVEQLVFRHQLAVPLYEQLQHLERLRAQPDVRAILEQGAAADIERVLAERIAAMRGHMPAPSGPPAQ